MKTSKNTFFDSDQKSFQIFDIIEDKNNEVLNRKEVKIIVEAEKNPGLVRAAELISSQFKASKELIAIKKVAGKFGRNTFLIEAFIYKSKEDKEKIEPKKKSKEKQEGQTEQGKQEEKKQEKQEAKK